MRKKKKVTKHKRKTNNFADEQPTAGYTGQHGLMRKSREDEELLLKRIYSPNEK